MFNVNLDIVNKQKGIWFLFIFYLFDNLNVPTNPYWSNNADCCPGQGPNMQILFSWSLGGIVEECWSGANLDEAVEAKKSSSSSPVLSYIPSGRMTDAEAAVLEAGLKEAAVRPANKFAEGQISAAKPVALLAALKKAVEEKKSSSSSHALNYITSGRMTAAEADVLKQALKNAAIRPSVRPANDATAMKTARKEAVQVKKLVRGANIDLSRDRQVPSKHSVVIKYRDFSWLPELRWGTWLVPSKSSRDQGRNEGDRGQEAHHERDQEGHGHD